MTDLKIAPRNLSEKQNYHIFMLNIYVYKEITIFLFSLVHLCLDTNKKHRKFINFELEAECCLWGQGVKYQATENIAFLKNENISQCL